MTAFDAVVHDMRLFCYWPVLRAPAYGLNDLIVGNLHTQRAYIDILTTRAEGHPWSEVFPHGTPAENWDGWHTAATAFDAHPGQPCELEVSDPESRAWLEYFSDYQIEDMLVVNQYRWALLIGLCAESYNGELDELTKRWTTPHVPRFRRLPLNIGGEPAS